MMSVVNKAVLRKIMSTTSLTPAELRSACNIIVANTASADIIPLSIFITKQPCFHLKILHNIIKKCFIIAELSRRRRTSGAAAAHSGSAAAAVNNAL